MSEGVKKRGKSKSTKYIKAMLLFLASWYMLYAKKSANIMMSTTVSDKKNETSCFFIVSPQL